MALPTVHDLYEEAGSPDLSHWSLTETFTLTEAIFLSIGCDPLDFRSPDIAILRKASHPNWRYAAMLMRSLKEGICTGEVVCISIYMKGYDSELENWVMKQVDVMDLSIGNAEEISEDLTKITRKSLYDWYKRKSLLRKNTVRSQQRTTPAQQASDDSQINVEMGTQPVLLPAPAYLDPTNPRYTPKLRAAVQAWLNVPEAYPGRTPKQSIEEWLVENSLALGLTHPDGKVMSDAIREIAKLVNWHTKGGPPKTPG